MRLKDILTPSNWRYFLQGKYRTFILNEYRKLFDDEVVFEALRKTSECPQCYKNGTCVEEDCGCNFEDVIFSDKPCIKGKF